MYSGQLNTGLPPIGAQAQSSPRLLRGPPGTKLFLVEARNISAWSLSTPGAWSCRVLLSVSSANDASVL
jgi:hypothetical protein